jgi:hypothetical protein
MTGEDGPLIKYPPVETDLLDEPDIGMVFEWCSGGAANCPPSRFKVEVRSVGPSRLILRSPDLPNPS